MSKAELDEQIRSAPDVWSSFIDLLTRAISDGKADLPDDQLYRGPSDARVTLASWAAKNFK